MTANCGEDSELHDEVEKFRQNLDLYKEVVRDPQAVIEQVEAQLQEDGEELEGEDADSKINSLVAKAMAPRNLTREEEEREAQKAALQDEEDAALSSEKQWTNLSMLGVIFVALALLILTIQVVKKKGDPAQDME